jgi:hypothetical protein
MATTNGIRALCLKSGPKGQKLQALTLAMPNLQTKHRNFKTNIKINAIRIENVKKKKKTNLPECQV